MSSNPFPGLRPFRPDEAHLFFGRESQVDAMIDRLAAAHFLAVVGSSGCGKSSLVSCGLRPALQRGLMSGAGSAWRIATCRPGADPITALAQTLAAPGLLFDAAAGVATGSAGAVVVPRVALVESTLRLSKRGLLDLVEQARLPAGVNLLLVIDQFEELFRYRALASADTRAAQDAVGLVNLLLEAVSTARQRGATPVYVVLTMRSDFLGDCTQFSGLPEAINAGQYLVPRMTRDERRAAISGPVAVAGAGISPTLLTRLVNDVGDNPDQLSILQHALNRTWSRWSRAGRPDGLLALPHYEAIGTMAHALDQHAERALAELVLPQASDPAAAGLLAERIFKALTDRAADPRGVRRPTRLDVLCAITESSPALITPVLAVFRKPSRSFLMPPADEPLTPDTVIDISHESLMRVWDRLKRWTEEEALSAQRYKRVAETAVLHAAGASALWRDPDLQLALDWRAQAKPNPAWASRYAAGFELAMAFLDHSLAERDAERQRDAEQARQAQQDQMARGKAEAQAELQLAYARRMRQRALLSTTLAVFALGLAGLAITQSREAERRRQDAEEAQRAALVSKARDEAERVGYIRQAETQRQLLKEAVKIDPRLAQTLQAQAAAPTVYIQYQGDEQKPLAEQLKQEALQQQLKAPDIERVRAGPRTPELRYFHDDDRQEAARAAAWMQNSPGLTGLVAKPVLGMGDKVKPGKMELWYGPPTRRLLVVAGSFAQRDNAQARLQSLDALGLDLRVIETRDYPNLREGFFAVVAGPFATEADANRHLERLSDKVRDAYVKSGW